ncbi:DUF6503 family protein [Croceitalea vernalis]|uniref:DUF6503 family protein n=1 Tax=Croceitalea vernalis TaxID=3075599 RepID=A0ABU3BKR5_9FLAO|nr:DUF6503 family protein [Croceitalea sp. P007]MDT0622739.1 DUF6503 family protein [Croceitalea sp. P007]
MKYISLFYLLFFIICCKPAPKEAKEIIKEESKEATIVKTYPKSLEQIFEAHGGLDVWKKQRTLIYTITKESNPETHTTDLWNRNDRIDTEQFSMGFDGKPWLLDSNKNYKGNVEFYHNLMFYFYAMPFVWADDGIVYGETEDLVFEGVNYPGISISYNNGVGTTPKDEYFIHFDAETHQMSWLGYTVTYRSGEKSDNVKWIRYDNWAAVNNLVLPKSITWHNYEGREIQEARNTVDFENISATEVRLSDEFYAKPEKAMYWQKPQK